MPLLLAAACDGDQESTPPRDPTDPADSDVTLDYAGPPLTAELEVMESEPPQYAVVVRIEAPTGGHALELEQLDTAGDPFELELKLTTPAADAVVTQAVEPLRVRTPLPAAPPAQGVVVRVATWQRDAEYLVPPQAQAAAVLEAP